MSPTAHSLQPFYKKMGNFRCDCPGVGFHPAHVVFSVWLSGGVDLGSRTQNLGFTNDGTDSDNPSNDTTYENPQQRLGHPLGASLETALVALAERLSQIDSDLATILSAWVHLPAPIKASLAAIAKATPPQTTSLK